MPTTYRVAVLMGGPSAEREISLQSGRAVASALAQAGYRIRPVDVQRPDGAELSGLDADVAFIALHGTFGEDGQIQGLLERRGLPYTGSGPVASRLAFDKLEAKRRFLQAGLETPPWEIIAEGDGREILERGGRSLGYPIVIKPRAQGSSLGVSIHRDRSRLAEGATLALRYGRSAIMEKFIAGREMTVAVLDGRPLPIIELRPKRAFFDFEAKYRDGGTEYIIDPDLPGPDRVAIQGAALRAHHALGCEGATRVDLIFTPRHQVHVLEVNTIPGLTERSLLPKAASAAGVPFVELCDRMVKSALRRGRGTGSWVAAALL